MTTGPEMLQAATEMQSQMIWLFEGNGGHCSLGTISMNPSLGENFCRRSPIAIAIHETAAIHMQSNPIANGLQSNQISPM
jgi:hypothetical protein